MEKQIEIAFGCLSASINAQLVRQGFSFDPEEIAKIDHAKDCVSYLNIAGYLTDTEVRNARNRIMKHIQKEVSKAKLEDE